MHRLLPDIDELTNFIAHLLSDLIDATDFLVFIPADLPLALLLCLLTESLSVVSQNNRRYLDVSIGCYLAIANISLRSSFIDVDSL